MKSGQTVKSELSWLLSSFWSQVAARLCLVLVSFVVFSTAVTRASESQADGFTTLVEPVIAEYCYDCHGDGSAKGKVALDDFDSHAARLADRDLWLRVLKNIRANLMPPAKKPRPNDDEISVLETWIKSQVFQIDPEVPDPGRGTLRRLNRVEYQNTIRDLMGIEFKAYEEFPPDDTGYGFDNIAEVLTVSPLLLEKYIQAAETIVAGAVPKVNKVLRELAVSGSEFLDGEGKGNRDRMSFYEAAQLSTSIATEIAGDYRLSLELEVDGEFDFDPGECEVVVLWGDRLLMRELFGWQSRKTYHFDFPLALQAGDHELVVELEPLIPEEEKKNSLFLELVSARLQGPLAEEHWVYPNNYERFFDLKATPENAETRHDYAGDLLRRFATKAFRRPVDEGTVARLTAIAEATYEQADKSFEEGVARAMVAVLSSTRFIFRIEDVVANAEETSPNLDEYSLASRLSYFLWSTMPDDALLELAAEGELRNRLEAEVERMLNHPRAEAFISNFVGQWLQARDIDGIAIDSRTVLARDAGVDKARERTRERFRELRAIPEEERTEEQRQEYEVVLAEFRKQFRRPRVELNGSLRRAMRRETEMLFARIAQQNRSVIELIDSDYTYLNKRLADHYKIPGIEGDEMQLVQLPPESPRGGVLTQGTVLAVTSNPTRTSPVKRGLFILDNILGTPAPPPPGIVPDLEEAEEQFSDHDPTLREALELHRKDPLCRSCHARMDPLGLALENFNALGMWRDTERGRSIDPTGRLITGEEFGNVAELKHILATDRRLDFYRCLTEKLLTYAIGRGLEYYDVQTVDDIVEQLEHQDGRFSALLMGIIDSAPFQKRLTTDRTSPELIRASRQFSTSTTDL